MLRTSPCSSADEDGVLEPREVLLEEDMLALATELYALRRQKGDVVVRECAGCRGVRLAKQAEAEGRLRVV